MSISPDAADVTARALAWLRDRANPFDSLVRPQRPDERFLHVHEPGVHRAEFENLRAVGEACRPRGYGLRAHQPGAGLADSRVVTVVGPRGAGKTHLLE